MLRYSLLIGLFLCLSTSVVAQKLTGISTRFSDSFREWIIFTDTEGREGELTLRWPAPELWGAWDYRLQEQFGRLRHKWPGRLDTWEAQGDGATVTASSVWRDDPREWRVDGPFLQVNWKSYFGNQREEWQTGDRSPGYFAMYTSYEGDPRDWIIVDELAPEVTLAEKIMLVLLTLYHSTPKV
jgi:hypothetical protein